MAVPPEILSAYDPERLRADGHRLIDALADQLAAWHRGEGPAVPWRPPAEARAAWARQSGPGELVEDLMAIARASTALAHPHVMAHQVPPPLPGAALAELVSAMLNNGMAVAEMGPASVPIELSVIDWMCGVLGLPAGAGGVLTSGGSLGNLTALLAMRGAYAGPPLAVLVGGDAHYSIARAVRIMGWGDEGAVPVKLDAAHRMTPEAVEKALASTDRRVIGIVAAAGSTATGAFDPLNELADFAVANALWLHVDAAHGGGVALSKTHRHLLAGIERADSVVWDAHKLLMMPALVTAVLYRRNTDAYRAFSQQASYLFADEEQWWDLGTRTLECTKRAMAIELWTALRVHGEAWFGQVVDRQIELTRALADRLIAAGFEVPLAPTANIVCYRHAPSGIADLDAYDLDAHNRGLRQKVLEDGRFYIVGTQLPGGYHLRSTIMNPLIEERDLDALVAHLQALCRS